MIDASTFGKAMHEALLEGWPFSLTEDPEPHTKGRRRRFRNQRKS